MPNINIVGRFVISGTPHLRHSSTVRVLIYSSGEVISAAIVTLSFGARLLTRLSKSLIFL